MTGGTVLPERRHDHTFWRHRPDVDFPPRSITALEDYAGGERLCLVITQTSLPAAAQKRLLAAWCERLPSLSQVKYLWFQSKVTQEMLDAACAMPGLEGLYIKWSAIRSLERLPQLEKLRQLFIGGAPSVTSIAPLGRMAHLTWLETENLKAVSDFSPLASLTNLVGLGVTGSMWSQQPIDTLRPFGKLTGLEWLGVSAASDGSLRPLEPLGRLKWLGLPNRYPVEELAWLSTRLPHTECRFFQPYEDLTARGFTCPKCKKQTVALMSGKGGKFLCLACDREKVDRHVRAFRALQDELR